MTKTRGAPIGSAVSLRMEHWEGERPSAGDYLLTEPGSTYLIGDIRAPRHGTMAAENGGFTVQAEKVTREEALEEGEKDPKVRLFEFVWIKRRRRIHPRIR